MKKEEEKRKKEEEEQRILFSLRARKEKKKEEEATQTAKEERRLEVTALLVVPVALRTPAQQRRIMTLSDEVDAEALSSQPGRRKRKKRRKKKLPRSSSLARAARTWVTGVSFSSPLYLTVLRSVFVCRQAGWFDDGHTHISQSTRAWRTSDPGTIPVPVLCLGVAGGAFSVLCLV